MKTILSFCAICLMASFACRADVTTSRSNVLSFFVVSESPVPGGRSIDTPEFSKLGYIRAQPDMVVLRLQSIATNTAHSFSRYAGKTTEVDEPAVTIVMFPADVKRFAQLTRQNVGNRLLLMLADRPLIAPIIRMPIETSSLQLTLGKRTDADRIRDDLKSLVQHE